MTPSMDMAVEARVPCPLCGGLIHPVAGRCKHCKQDLVALRSAKPAAPVKLPALDLASDVRRPASEIVLPVSRTPEAGSPTSDVPPVPSAWRSWPVIVMGVSVLAILGALFVLFVLPESEPAHAGKLPPAQPMPERMPTDPLPQADPWGGAQPSPPHAQAVPAPKAQDDDTDQLDQQFAIPAQGTFGAHMLVRACEKFTKCGTTNQFIEMWCAQVTSIKPMLGPTPTCDEGKRCFDAIDRMSCSAKPNDVTVLMTLLPDCLQATQDC